MFYGAYGGFNPWGEGISSPSLETATWGVRHAGTTPFGTGLTVPGEPPLVLAGLGRGGFGPGLGGVTPAGTTLAPGDFPSPFGAGGDWAGFTAAGFGGVPVTLPLHGGGAFMNASGMGTGFWISSASTI